MLKEKVKEGFLETVSSNSSLIIIHGVLSI